MSLHNLAQHLQSAGRGDDKVLVHMTPGEVKGLQSLAMAHGGSLTINPQTGLPEAGILGKLLPTVLGFALGPAGMGIQIGGLSSAASAGLISGAIGTLTSGSLGKGIMAGLGAYGGASLGESFVNAGVQANAANQAQAWRDWSNAQATPSLAKIGVPPTTAGATTAVDTAAAAKRGMSELDNLLAEPPSAAGYGSQEQLDLRRRMLSGPEVSYMRPPEPGQTYNLAGTIPPAPPVKTVEEAIRPVVSQGTKQPFSFDTSTPSGRTSMAWEGMKEVFSDKDKLWNFAKENPLAIASVAIPLMQQDRSMPGQEKPKPLEKYRYTYDRTPVGVPMMSSAERDYFPNARYVPTGEYYAGGGLMALAEGGPIEDMSRMNAVGANTGYPMADQMSSTYATSAQRPISENVLRPQGDSNVDPYTGEQKFDDGGYVRYTGQGKPPGNDYYYVSPLQSDISKPGYYMYKGDASGAAGGVGDIDFFDPNYYNPSTGTFGYQAGAAAPKLGTQAVQQTKEMLNPMYQKYFGRDIDPSGLAAYTAKPFSEADLAKIFTASPEYQAAAPLRAAKEREANLATKEQIADAYERILGRQPDIAGLRNYAQKNRLTPEELEKELSGSEEAFVNLTKPFVPAITYNRKGVASIEGAPKYNAAQYGFAGGGLSDLGAYSDGGRLLKGPGDGVSDSIPAVIGERQPARLADGEFVIPARIVSEIGNGSTEAGARKLYAMMDRVQKARRKTTGKDRVAANTRADKYLPA